VTRHPIYTGFLGMIIGTMLLAGGHELVAIVVVGLVLFEVKIHQEERLMIATFPDEYARVSAARAPDRSRIRLIPWHAAARRHASGTLLPDRSAPGPGALHCPVVDHLDPFLEDQVPCRR